MEEVKKVWPQISRWSVKVTYLFYYFWFLRPQLMLKTTTISLLHHIYIRSYLDKQTRWITVYIDFWPPSNTYDVMTYVTWQRQDDVTYVKMCLPLLVTDTLKRCLRLESSKKLQWKNARGWYPHPGRPRVEVSVFHEMNNALNLKFVYKITNEQNTHPALASTPMFPRHFCGWYKSKLFSRCSL